MRRLILAVLASAPAACYALGFFGAGGGGGGVTNVFTTTVTSSGLNITGDTDTGVVSGGADKLDLQAGGATVLQVAGSATNAKVLLKNPTVAEVPMVASINFPNTGLLLSNSNIYTIIGNNATTEFLSQGGYFTITLMGSSRKDGDGHGNPNIQNEINGDGITWVDNRLPDGTQGHDADGRFIDFEMANQLGRFRVGVSSAGFMTGTNPLGGTVAIGSSNSQFAIMGSTHTGANTVGLGTSNSPAAASTAPKWIRFRLCTTAGTNCANYYMPAWAE